MSGRWWGNDPAIQLEMEDRGHMYWQTEPVPIYERIEHEREIMDDLANVGDQQTRAISLGGVDLKPSQVIKMGQLVSSQLNELITARPAAFSVEISGRRFLRCDGWTTLGTILGCSPIVETVEEIEPGTWLAWARIETNDGRVKGRASAICGTDEKLWGSRTNNQRRSMAQTRAIAKAYRVAFAWITVLAGYEPTTAEEMETGEPEVPGTVQREDGLTMEPTGD